MAYGGIGLTPDNFKNRSDGTAWETGDGKPGATPAGTLPILERLSLDLKVWCDHAAGFGRLLYSVAGQPHVIDAMLSRVTAQSFCLRGEV